MADPTMDAADPGASQDPADQSGADSGGGYCIEIHVAGDGSIKVSVEPESEESAEESAGAGADGGAAEGDEGDDEGQSVANIREAMKVVMDIYKNAGQMQDASGEDEMAAGYK